MKEFIIEIIKFFKNNYIKIILGTLVIAVPYVWFNSSTNIEDVDSLQIESESETNAIESETEIVETDANPASFKFFAEHEDGYPFTNNLLLFNYLTTSDMLREAELNTQTNIIDIMTRTNNEIYFSPSESSEYTMSKVFGLSKSPDTHINELYVNVGNEEDNLALVNYFYDMVTNDEIPILDNKIIYLFQEPRILDIEVDEPVETIEVPTDEPFGTTIVVGVTLGLFFSIGILLMISFFSKKLYYLFTYSIREDDTFIVMDKNIDFEKDLQFILSNPSESQNVIVTEGAGPIKNTEFGQKLDELLIKNKITKVNNIFEIENHKNIDRLLYLIEEGETSRSWYTKQRKYDEIYDLPAILIQINRNQQDMHKEKN